MKCAIGTRCEKCGSTNMTKELIQSYSVGKGLVGQAIFGAGGAAMGVNGKNEYIYNCGDCGHTSKHILGYYEASDIMECITHPVTNSAKKEMLARKYPNIDWSGKDVGLSSVEENLVITEKTNSVTTSGKFNRDGTVDVIIKCIKYKLNEDEDFATIIGYDKNIGGNLKIPNEITYENKTYKVTHIAKSAFSGCQTIRSIEIACSVISIGERAFYQCSNVSVIYIPASVETIGKDAFYECGILYHMSKNGLVKPDVYCEYDNVGYDFHQYWFNLHTCAEDKFTNNSGYTDITLNNIKYRLFRNKAVIIELLDKNICDLIIPEIIESNSKKYIVFEIESCAFLNCTPLISITIPKSVTSIKKDAFKGCKKTKFYCEIERIPQDWQKGWKPLLCKAVWGVEHKRGFKNINVISNATNNDNSTTEENDFPECIIPEGVTNISENEFKGRQDIIHITIPSGVTSIGKCAFQDCYRLKSITIPDSVTSIDDFAFRNCYKLKSIAIPNGVTSIGESTFQNCTELSDVTLPNSLTTIEDFAFDGCRALTSINIPFSVTSIGSYAFQECSAIASIIIPLSVTKIGFAAFYMCDNLTIYCEVEKQPSGWYVGEFGDWNIYRPTIWGYKGRK